MLDDVEYIKAPSCTFQNVFRFCSHKIVMLICACATKDVFKTMFTPKLFNNLLPEYIGSIAICILFCIVFPVPFFVNLLLLLLLLSSLFCICPPGCAQIMGHWNPRTFFYTVFPLSKQCYIFKVWQAWKFWKYSGSSEWKQCKRWWVGRELGTKLKEN